MKILIVDNGTIHLDKIKEIQDAQSSGKDISSVPDWQLALENPYFKPTALTGKYLQRANVAFDPTTNKPEIQLKFNDEGAKIFAEITARNVGKQLAIYLP